MSGLYDPCLRRLETANLPSGDFSGYLPTLTKLTRRFLKPNKGRLIIGLDNGPIHRPEALQEELQKSLNKEGERVTVLFFPTHSPNTNAIEGVWQQLLKSVPRACDTPQELQTMFQLALTEQRRSSQEKSANVLKLHCPICRKTFFFDKNHKKDILHQVEKHLCFNIPNLNPYTVQVLTHSLEKGGL